MANSTKTATAPVVIRLHIFGSLLCHTCALFAITFFFFFNDTATTEIYTLPLHDALPILKSDRFCAPCRSKTCRYTSGDNPCLEQIGPERVFGELLRSEEHTSELQSHSDLVCRLLLEKKKKQGKRTWRTLQRPRQHR